jgi:hypothetical protein
MINSTLQRSDSTIDLHRYDNETRPVLNSNHFRQNRETYNDNGPSRMTDNEVNNSSIILLLNRLQIENARLRNIIYQEQELKYNKQATIILNIQDTLFENSEQIPSGLYIKLMNTLIGKN